VRRRGRPVLGALAGLVLGLFLGLDLVLLGLIPLDSVLVTVLAGAGLVGGVVVGLTAPFGSAPPPPPEPPPPPPPPEPPATGESTEVPTTGT
jgi:hypothetical protein